MIRHFFTAAVLIAGTGAWSQTPGCGPYRVAFYETGLLYFKDRAGDYVGIDRMVLDEVAQRTGCVFERFLDSRVRAWAALSNGQFDLTVSGIEPPQR